MNLSKLIERYYGAAATMAQHIRETQQNIGAANLIGQQILGHPDFQKMPVEGREQFIASQISAAEMLKSFEGFNQ